jgi:hypothetical protein
MIVARWCAADLKSALSGSVLEDHWPKQPGKDYMAAKHLLIIANTPSENTRILRDTVVHGA